MKVFGRAPAVSGKVLGANGNINVALIGVGGRGSDLLEMGDEDGEQPNTPRQGGRGLGCLCEALEQSQKRPPSAKDFWTIARYSNARRLTL